MFNGKKICHVVAATTDGTIGLNGEMAWHCPEDLRKFREITLGHALLMGRTTFEGLPRQLSRRAIRVATKLHNHSDEASIAHHLMQASNYSDLLNTDRIYIVGGSQIYDATLPYTDEIYLTSIDTHVEGDAKYLLNTDLFEYEGDFHRQAYIQAISVDGEIRYPRISWQKWVRKA